MSITYVTMAIPGKHSKKSISQLLTPIMLLAKQAFGIVATQNTTPNSIAGLPHAFTTFNTATQCANDSALAQKGKGKRNER